MAIDDYHNIKGHDTVLCSLHGVKKELSFVDKLINLCLVHCFDWEIIISPVLNYYLAIGINLNTLD